MPKPRFVEPNDPITAEDHNSIVREMGFGPGRDRFYLASKRGGRLASDAALPAYITAVIDQSPPGENPTAPDVFYSAQPHGRGTGSGLAEEVPPSRIIGRPNYNGRAPIVPAAVGDECTIHRVPQPDGTRLVLLEVKTEVFMIADPCTPGESVGVGDGVDGVGNGVGNGVGETDMPHETPSSSTIEYPPEIAFKLNEDNFVTRDVRDAKVYSVSAFDNPASPAPWASEAAGATLKILWSNDGLTGHDFATPISIAKGGGGVRSIDVNEVKHIILKRGAVVTNDVRIDIHDFASKEI